MKISVHIKPNTKHLESVERLDDGSYAVHTKAPAVDGKANAIAARLLAVHFGVAPTHISLVRGATSRYKTFEIQNESRFCYLNR